MQVLPMDPDKLNSRPFYNVSDNEVAQPGTTTFLGWNPEQELQDGKNKPRTRLYHKKSRLGCIQCKQRRVKCDEVFPRCGSCQKHEMTCVYNQKPPTPKTLGENLADRTRSRSVTESASPPSVAGSSKDSHQEPAESRQRRQLELRLLYQYMGYSCSTVSIFIDAQPKIEYYWKVAVPELALDHEALLYAVYTYAALHLAVLYPDNREYAEAHQRYLELTIKTHRDQVASLNKFNADATCLASSFVRLNIFAVMAARNREPYLPPVAWLTTTKLASGVFMEAWKWVSDDETSIARAFWKATPQLRDWDSMYSETNRKGLDYLLHRTPEDEMSEPWDEEIVEAYGKTVSFLGGMKTAVEEGELEAHTFRRAITFAMYIHRRYIDLVEEQRPRALVILAHFFALLTKFSHVWWIGDAGKKEILGILTILPDEWMHLMAWPCQVLENPSLIGSSVRR